MNYSPVQNGIWINEDQGFKLLGGRWRSHSSHLGLFCSGPGFEGDNCNIGVIASICIGFKGMYTCLLNLMGYCISYSLGSGEVVVSEDVGDSIISCVVFSSY